MISLGDNRYNSLKISISVIALLLSILTFIMMIIDFQRFINIFSDSLISILNAFSTFLIVIAWLLLAIFIIFSNCKICKRESLVIVSLLMIACFLEIIITFLGVVYEFLSFGFSSFLVIIGITLLSFVILVPFITKPSNKEVIDFFVKIWNFLLIVGILSLMVSLMIGFPFYYVNSYLFIALAFCILTGTLEIGLSKNGFITIFTIINGEEIYVSNEDSNTDTQFHDEESVLLKALGLFKLFIGFYSLIIVVTGFL